MHSITLDPDQKYLGIVNDLITIETNGIFEHYNPKYYAIQNKVTKIKIPNKAQDKDQEIKNLIYFRSLSGKLKNLYNQINKAKTTQDETDFILLGRRIEKTRTSISKYLDKLNKDNNFKITKEQNNLVLSYKGQFVQAKSICPYSEGVV